MGTELNVGTGGDVLKTTADATPEVYQHVILSLYGGGTPVEVANANPVPISDAGGSLTVDGIVTANIGTAGTLATEATLSTIAGTVSGSEVQVDVVTSALPAGAATEATLAAASAKLPATLGQKTKATSLAVTLASDEDALSVTGTVGISGTVAATQSGSWAVTANAGTNLNTSLLALESGGNLATLAGAVSGSEIQVDLVGGAGLATITANQGTVIGNLDLIQDSVSVMDDWDESNRAKVNPIVGQAGVAAGSGVVGLTTQRVVLATDVALPAGTNAIGKLAANDGVDIGDVTVNNATLAVTQSGTWNLTNISGTISLPTGAATAANQSTANGHLATLAGAVSGTEVQVDIVASLPAGTNAIGKLAANSGVDIGDVDVTSQPARAATTDTITAKLATDAIQNGTTALTPKFAVVDEASSGDNTLVAAVSSKKIRVLSYVLVAAGAVTVRFEDGASGTALSGQMSLTANTGVSCGFSPVGHFETSATTLLNMELSAAVQVSGHLTYIEV